MLGRRFAALLGPLLLAAPLLAQEDEEEVVLWIRDLSPLPDLSDEESGEAYALIGRVVLEIEGRVSVRAERAVVWFDPRVGAELFDLVQAAAERKAVPAWAVRAIYAEGGRVPAVFQTQGMIFRCSALYYDLRAHHATVLDADLRMRRGNEEPFHLVFRARAFRSRRPGEWRAEHVRIASTPYYEPKLYLKLKRIVLDDEKVRAALERLTLVTAAPEEDEPGPSEAEIEEVLQEIADASLDVSGKRMTLEGITARLYGVPFFYWPRHTHDFRGGIPVKVSLELGGHGRLDDGIRVGVGQELEPDWGTLLWHVGVGYYHRRGPLADLETEVSALDGRVRARSFTVFLRDHGRDFGMEPSTRNRYWTRHQARWEISPAWRLDGEYADLSDALWLRVYDEREFKEGKEQETLLYLRRRGRRTYATLTGKAKTIAFQETVEELPRATFALPVLSLPALWDDARGEPWMLQLAGGLEAGNLRYDPPDGLAADYRTARFAADATLFLAFGIGAVRIVPFHEFRVDAWERALDGESLVRYAPTAGVRADVQASRLYGDVRHLVNLSVAYESLYSLTASSDELFPLDRTELVSRYDMVSARLRNRLVRYDEDGPWAFLSLELFGAWFPGAQRPFGEEGEALFETEAAWQPTRALAIEARAGILHLEDARLDAASIVVRWAPRDDLSFAGGVRHLAGDSDIVTLEAERLVGERWRLAAFSQFDFRNGDSLDHGVLIQRLGQTLVVGVRLQFDPGDDDFSASVNLDLLELFRRSRREYRDVRDEIGWR